jgi:uncharacterized protein
MAQGPTVAVRGEAVLEVPPEVARVEVSVAAGEKDQATTLKVLGERASAVDKILASFPDAIEKTETSGVRVSPLLASRTIRSSEGYHTPGQHGPGYHGAVYHVIMVSAFDRLGELMAQLADEDQVEVGGPWWELRPGSPVYAQVRVAAVKDAVRRARDYAAALGSALAGLVELADAKVADTRGMPESVPSAAARLPQRVRAATADELGADLKPAPQIVRAAVEARFTIAAPDLAGV